MTQRDDLLGRLKELHTGTKAHRATSRVIRSMIFDGDYAGAMTALDTLEDALHPALAAGGGEGAGALQALVLVDKDQPETAQTLNSDGNEYGELAPFGAIGWEVIQDDFGALQGPENATVALPEGFYLAGGYVDLTGNLSNVLTGEIAAFISADQDDSLSLVWGGNVKEPAASYGTTLETWASLRNSNGIHAPTVAFFAPDGSALGLEYNYRLTLSSGAVQANFFVLWAVKLL